MGTTKSKGLTSKTPILPLQVYHWFEPPLLLQLSTVSSWLSLTSLIASNRTLSPTAKKLLSELHLYSWNGTIDVTLNTRSLNLQVVNTSSKFFVVYRVIERLKDNASFFYAPSWLSSNASNVLMNLHFISGSAERISSLLIHPLMTSYVYSQEMKHSTSFDILSRSLLMSPLKRVPFSNISTCESYNLNMASALTKLNTSVILYWILG